MIETKENPQHQFIQFQETEPLSIVDSVEGFLFENGLLILITALGLMIAITVWHSSRF